MKHKKGFKKSFNELNKQIEKVVCLQEKYPDLEIQALKEAFERRKLMLVDNIGRK